MYHRWKAVSWHFQYLWHGAKSKAIFNAWKEYVADILEERQGAIPTSEHPRRRSGMLAGTGSVSARSQGTPRTARGGEATPRSLMNKKLQYSRKNTMVYTYIRCDIF
jgi:hypothetical protein